MISDILHNNSKMKIKKSKSIIEFLRERQTVVSVGPPTEHVQCLCNRVIPLPTVMDQERQLTNGHVILGFSQCGRYLLSYQHVVLDHCEHEYTLHWWTFNLYQPLSHLSEHALFRQSFQRDLHLVIAQTPDQLHTVVFGCMSAVEDEDRRVCHVTIVPGPGLPGPSIYLQYELLPPFPSPLPHLTLRIPGCLLVNTGDRLIAVLYTPTLTATETVHCQQFSWEEDSVGLDTGDCTPIDVLPVEVFVDQRQLYPGSEGEVCVGQSVLDVEVWANCMLCSELDSCDLSYHCLRDYDLEIVDVCMERREAVFVMATLLEVSNSLGSRDCVSVTVVGVWNVFEGVATLRSVSTPTLVLGHTHPPVSITAKANKLRAQSCIPSGPHVSVRVFSNQSVHSGKSLHYLSHPRLPVYLFLHKQTS